MSKVPLTSEVDTCHHTTTTPNRELDVVVYSNVKVTFSVTGAMMCNPPHRKRNPQGMRCSHRWSARAAALGSQ